MNVNSDIANSTDERTVDFEWAMVSLSLAHRST